MIPKFAFFTSLLLASASVALPSSGESFDSRAGGSNIDEWAGAVWSQSSRTFSSVTATFTVPTLNTDNDGAASAWVGIDGYNCGNAILRTGVDFTAAGGAEIYDAWYQWYPGEKLDLRDITISAGDVITTTVLAPSMTSGTVIVENLTTDQTTKRDLVSNTPLCGQDAEWIVGTVEQDGKPVPLANFGSVTFNDAFASGPSSTYTPDGATLLNIQQNGKARTFTSTRGSSLTVHYI